jgi:hypothetical protein
MPTDPGHTDDDAVAQLRRVLRQAGLSVNDAPALSDDVSRCIIERLESWGAGGNAPDPDPVTEADVAREALMLLAVDPAYAPLVSGRAGAAVEEPQGPDFAVDPLTFVGVGTLGLIALSTYVHFKRTPEGTWSLEIKVQPASDKMKRQVIKLANKLIGLPTL